MTQLNDAISHITELSGSPTFCILPWLHLATRPNGDMRLCCVSNSSGVDSNDLIVGIVKKEDGTPSNFASDTPMSAWNNDYMCSVRKTMLDGKIPASCTKCFKEEAAGVVSKRVWETKFWYEEGITPKSVIDQTSDNGKVPKKLAYLDLRLGHTCNLKCVMCSPHDSSRWMQDYDAVMTKTNSQLVKQQITFDRHRFDNKWFERSTFWTEIYDQIPNLKQVYFVGGEPLMIKEHKLFLEEIIRQGYADQILIRYSSNGLLLDEELIEMWKYFKKVKFAISIDAYGDRNHYIRYPTEWNTIEKNLRRLDETPDNIIVSIATAIQVMNIMHLPEFVKWKIQQNYKKINLAMMPGEFVMGGGLVNMHLLYIPTFLSARILPNEYKKLLVDKFADFKQWLWDHYTQDDNFWLHSPYGWSRWEAGLKFILEEDLSYMVPDFVNYIHTLDSIRGTNFSDIFPELKGLLHDETSSNSVNS